MTTITATKARSRLYSLLDETAEHHEPIQITSKRSNGIRSRTRPLSRDWLVT